MSEQKVRYTGWACIDLPVDKNGDADPGRAKYLTETFETAEAAARWAIKHDMHAEGLVEVEEKYYVSEYRIWQWGPVDRLDPYEILNQKRT